MNPINDYPEVRKVLYVIQWVVTGIQTVLSAYFAFALGDVAEWPRWFLATLAVTPVLWAYLGVTAQSNTGTLGEADEDATLYETHGEDELPTDTLHGGEG